MSHLQVAVSCDEGANLSTPFTFSKEHRKEKEDIEGQKETPWSSR